MGQSLLDGGRAVFDWFANDQSGIMPILTLLSIVALVLQIRAATQNSKREKAVDIFQRCLNEFEMLLSLKLTIAQQANKPKVNSLRVAYYFNRYWDLFNTEYEYAKYDLIPRSLFLHFCVRLRHAFHHQTAEGLVGGVSIAEGWDRYGRAAHIGMSPQFCAMIDSIRTAADDEEVRRIVPRYLKKRRREDFFGSFT